ncbi:MAG TPA: zf-HC2 domain-containing protein [Pyrinomonadaceae bacterium]
MFARHYRRHLSAFAHGELSAGEAARVAAHLDACAACRSEFEEVRLGIRLAESLPSVAAPEHLWEGIEAALAKESNRERRGASWLQALFPSRRRALNAAFATLLIALVAGGAWLYLRARRPGWEVARVEGAPRVASGRMGERGRLRVGEWLETDATSRAEIAVANIGQVEVEPNTRVRLVETRLTEHRLELERGTLHARIWAPPRLFFVNTPSAVAADLGCAYTLEVDDAGRGLLHVTSGYVALEAETRESIVPAGAACMTQPGAGPGTPFFEDAPEAFVESLARLDFENDRASLAAVLAGARAKDTLTLWHLLARVGREDRARVYERLAALAPPPEGVTRDGIEGLDRAMLDAWKADLEGNWLGESTPAVRRAWRGLWR